MDTPKATVKAADLLSTGSTMLDLALQDRVAGGFPKGKYILFVGDSESGKTFFCLTCIAEAVKNKNFDDYNIIFDAPEDGAMMDMGFYFGAKAVERIQPPKGTVDEPEYSHTAEQFYYNLDTWLKKGPCIYILDSENALSSDADEKKFKKKKMAAETGAQEAGSFGGDKPKEHGKGLKRARRMLRATGSILIIISQTRDRIGFGAQFDPKTRSGGHALKFYADLEIWSSVFKQITKVVREKKRQVGAIVQLKVKKNRATGKKRTVLVPFFQNYGIDNLSSMINYLIDEGHWTGTETSVSAPDFEFSGPKHKLIRMIEDNNLERQLKSIVLEVWQDVEAATRVHRKLRYT